MTKLGYSDQILAQQKPGRQLALDVFRGLTITAMILVNNPGSWSYLYAPLRHADWHGWTPTDLIFPFFLFIVGVALALSRQHKRSLSAAAELWQGAKRSLKLIAIGLLLGLFWYNFADPNFSYLQDKLYRIRYFGVLQRIGLVFILTLALVMFLPRKAWISVAVVMTALYGLALEFIPYPLRDSADPLQMANNLTAYIDTQLFGAVHLYKKELQPYGFDPEGLLSTLPAIASTLAGYWAGLKLQLLNPMQLVKHFVLSGLLFTAAGLLLDVWQPVNKSLWTPAFVSLTTGLALLCYALCIYVVDVMHYRRWSAPFIVFGANAILFFVFAAVLARILMMLRVDGMSLQQQIFAVLQQYLGNYPGSFAYSLVFLLVSYLVMHICYRRGWFWKV